MKSLVILFHGAGTLTSFRCSITIECQVALEATALLTWSRSLFQGAVTALSFLCLLVVCSGSCFFKPNMFSSKDNCYTENIDLLKFNDSKILSQILNRDQFSQAVFILSLTIPLIPISFYNINHYSLTSQKYLKQLTRCLLRQRWNGVPTEGVMNTSLSYVFNGLFSKLEVRAECTFF